MALARLRYLKIQGKKDLQEDFNHLLLDQIKPSEMSNEDFKRLVTSQDYIHLARFYSNPNQASENFEVEEAFDYFCYLFQGLNFDLVMELENGILEKLIYIEGLLFDKFSSDQPPYINVSQVNIKGGLANAAKLIEICGAMEQEGKDFGVVLGGSSRLELDQNQWIQLTKDGAPSKEALKEAYLDSPLYLDLAKALKLVPGVGIEVDFELVQPGNLRELTGIA